MLLCLCLASVSALAQPVSCSLERSGALLSGDCLTNAGNASLSLEPGEDRRLFEGELAFGSDPGFPVTLRLPRSGQREPILSTPFGWFGLRDFEHTERAMRFVFNLGRQVAPDATDLRILDRTLEILDVPARWDRNDDRVCEQGDRTFSLYCALHRAMVDVTGSFEHRRPALQTVRLVVEQVSGHRRFEHRLMDFNNLDSTELSDIQRVLKIARHRVAAAVEGRASIQLVAMTTLGVEEERTPFLTFGDVDGDGHADVVVANGRHWPGQNRLFVNNGEGRFMVSRLLGDEQATSYAAPLADLDGDGDLDIAVGNDRARNLLLWNDGTGRFTVGDAFGGIESTRGVTLADLDTDGDVDILLTNRGDENAIFLNDGSGGFDSRRAFGSSDDSTIDVAAGDLDGDGDLDLALANRDGQGNVIYLNDGNASFEESRPYGTGSDETRSVALADLNGDGLLDVVNANIGEANGVYFGNGEGGVSGGVRFGRADGRSYTVVVADMDDDGDTDIVIGNVAQQNAVFFNLGDGREFVELRFGAEEAVTYGLDIADLNGDRFPEVATANSDGPNVLYANSGLRVR